MYDPNLAILQAYQSALANLSVGGTAIPVYPAIAPLKNVPSVYVLLSGQTYNEQKTKCGYWWDAFITTDIVTKYPNGKGDVIFAMEVGEAITGIVQSSTFLTLQNFSIRDVKQDPPQQLPIQEGTQDIYRYLLNFRMKINRA